MNNNTVYEWILQTTFTVAERAKSLQCLEQHIVLGKNPFLAVFVGKAEEG